MGSPSARSAAPRRQPPLSPRLRPRPRPRLTRGGPQMPLARILEGGTWAAGRELAFARSKTGDPPIQINSSGDVF